MGSEPQQREIWIQWVHFAGPVHWSRIVHWKGYASGAAAFLAWIILFVALDAGTTHSGWLPIGGLAIFLAYWLVVRRHVESVDR